MPSTRIILIRIGSHYQLPCEMPSVCLIRSGFAGTLNVAPKLGCALLPIWPERTRKYIHSFIEAWSLKNLSPVLVIGMAMENKSRALSVSGQMRA